MKKRLQIVLCMLVMLFVMSGCGGSDMSAESMVTTDSVMLDGATGGTNSYDDVYMYEYGEAETEEAPMEPAAPEAEVSEENADSDRKLITTMHISAETENFDVFIENVENRVEELGGYVESSSVYNMYSELRAADYKIRVPEENLDSFTGLVAEESNVVSRSRQVEDVTLTYVDLQSRKEVLETEQVRLLEMLGQAEDIETILAIETRLSEVQGSIESMESQLRTFDNAINYSTVYLYIEEVKVYTVVEQEEETAWEQMTNGFVNSLEKVGLGLRNFGIGFVVAIPYLIVIAVIVLIFVLIIRGIIKTIIRRDEKRKRLKSQNMGPVPQNMGPTPYGVNYVSPQMMAPQSMPMPENGEGKKGNKTKEE